MKKFNLFLIIVAFLLGNHFLFSQAVDRLYLSSASTGRVYDITSLTGGALPTPITIPNSSGTPSNISNLAVGYDQPGGNPSTLVFINSNTAAGSTLFKNGTAVTGTVMPSVAIGGIATNNVPGTYFGNVYGFQSGTKSLYPIYPSGAAVSITSTDTDWINGTTFGTDTFFDYQNNIYTFINNGSNRYLFKISLATGVAEKAISAPISGSASFANLPTSRGIQGMAYLQGFVYIASVNNNNIEIRRININDGTSILAATYTSPSSANLDLATVPYYVPFQFSCGSYTWLGSPVVAGTSATQTLRVDINSVLTSGTYSIDVSGTDITTATQNVTITAASTFIDIPVTYNGGGTAGTRYVTISLGGSTTTCSIPLNVVNDSDGDGVPDSLDLDDDNDGILDCDENLLGANASVSNVFSFVTAGTAVATSNNEVRLTQDTGNQAGQIWSVGKVDFTKSFVLRFDAYLGTRDNGADGIAAVFHNSPQGVNATGATGLGIGARGIANGIVLELDTYNNGTSLGDIPSDHGQIWDSDNQTSTGFLTTAVALPNLENSTWHPVVINWNATTKTISYTVDGTNAGTYTGDLVTNYFAGASKVYFGYTASTGGSTNEQRIRINSFCSDLPIEMDSDNDGTPNQFDLDSDNDGCPDAIEGGDNVTAGMLDGIGRINVAANGTTTPVVVDAQGVPVITNTGSTFNVDGQAQGQTAGSSANASVNGCYCYKPAQTTGTTLDTNHGITALGRAGADNSNWPMVRKGAWTVLEAKTKGFVVNRLTDAQIAAIPSADLREGMMVYNINQDCLQINIDGTATGWKCFNTQTCPDL